MSKSKHHYVPKFYLRNFSSNGKSIRLFSTNKSLYIKNASIKEQAYKKHLYGKTNDIEDSLMKLEGIIAKITRNILDNLELPSKGTEEYEFLLLYLLVAEARVQKIADSQNNFLTEQMRTIAKMDKNLTVPDNLINKIKITYDVPNLLPIQTAIKVYPILYDLSIILMISDCDRRFITSDNPLVRYNQFYVCRNYQTRGYGLGNVGIQLFYPLSPKVCLCIYDTYSYHCDGLNKQTLKLIKGKDIDELNKLFYLNSIDCIFFSNEISETYIRRIINGLTPVHNVKNEVNIFGSDENKLICFQQSFVKQRIKMPFMKLNPKLLNMPLPAHMAGPIRPYAKRFEKHLKE